MSKRSTIVHFRSKGQEELPPDPERIARLEREKEETKRREQLWREKKAANER